MSFKNEFMTRRSKRCHESNGLTASSFHNSSSSDLFSSPHLTFISTSLASSRGRPRSLVSSSPSSPCAFDASCDAQYEAKELPCVVQAVYDGWDADHASDSSATILSRPVSPTQTLGDVDRTFPEFALEHHSSQPIEQGPRFLYPLHEPGERIAKRTQRLRARTAAVVRSLPATVEEIIDISDKSMSALSLSPSRPGIYGEQNASCLSVASSSKLRRVSGSANLHHTFRSSGRVQVRDSRASRVNFSDYLAHRCGLDNLHRLHPNSSPLARVHCLHSLPLPR